MRVGIYAHILGSELAGHQTYLRNMLHGLARIDPAGDYMLFVNSPLSAQAASGLEHMQQRVQQPGRVIRLPLGRHRSFQWTQPSSAASRALRCEKIDVVHVQDAAPLLFGAPLVVTLHDISYERYPQYFTSDIVLKYRIRVALTLRRADAVITGSEFSKRDIVRRYLVSPDKVTVATGGPDPHMRVIHDQVYLQSIREKYSSGQHFILYVGNLEPRKNLKTLIASYIKLRQADTTRHKLIIVGRQAWLYDEVFAVAHQSGYIDDVVFTGYVPDDELVAMFNAADLFVFPSLFEGLGFPPLEAMACGTPVITSNVSSLPEVVGDAALTIDPLDSEALATAMASVLLNMDLQDELRQRGFRHVAAYSWDVAAHRILDVYRKVAHRR